MELDSLIYYFDSSPAAKLLRAQHAPYVVRFLFEQFKHPGQIAIPHSELLPALSSFQEEVQEVHPEALRDKAETYLADWCSGEKLWLHRFLEAGRDEPLYQLTSASEEVIEFLDRTLGRPKGFVGTESRLKHVIETLEKLVVGASRDPAVHLEHLQAELDRITHQIERIEGAGQPAFWPPTRIREQFALAVSMLKELQRDFRAVEEKFKRITQQVQQRQVGGYDSRGGILAGALDAEDALRKDDQGVSFYEFFRFIQSPEQQERLRSIILQLGRIEELVQQQEGLASVRRMMPLLLAEASKVTQTERRLSATLRRLLDVQAHRERQRVADLLREIRGLAVSLADSPPRDLELLEVDDSLAITSPLSRTFWSQPPQFEHVDLTEHAVDDQQRFAQFEQFALMQRINFTAMRACIRDAVSATGAITLRDLLAMHPPEAGVLDILGFLQIASDDGHLISHETDEEIVIPAALGGRPMAVTVPLVTFVQRSRR